MKKQIVIAGGSGFLGRALSNYFLERQAEVVVLTRSPQPRTDGVKEIAWDGKSLGEWAKCVDGAEAIVDLAGKSVDCRYNEKNRREIIASRVDSTRAIGEAIAKCKSPPCVWLNASSATLYKHSFGRPLDENGETGSTPEAKDEFSIAVIRQWEDALTATFTPHTRKVALRMTIVFGRNSGALPVFKRLAKLGLAGAMGSGRQLFSWTHELDYCRALEWIIAHDDLAGAINIAAPNPLPNREVMRLIREACGAPFGLPAAEWMLEVGAFFLRTETELLIKSRNVWPGRLLASGFQFQFPELRSALADLCE